MVWKRKKKEPEIVDDQPTKVISTAKQTVKDLPPEKPQDTNDNEDPVMADLMKKVEERRQEMEKEKQPAQQEEVKLTPEIEYGMEIFNREYGMITLDNIDTKLLFAIFTEIRLLRGQLAEANKK